MQMCFIIVKPRCFLLRSWPVCMYDACGKSSCRFIFRVKYACCLYFSLFVLHLLSI